MKFGAAAWWEHARKCGAMVTAMREAVRDADRTASPGPNWIGPEGQGWGWPRGRSHRGIGHLITESCVHLLKGTSRFESGPLHP